MKKIDADSNGADRRPRRTANAAAGPNFGGGRPPSLPQADGDPVGGPTARRARPGGTSPKGSYGELNYRDEDSPRGILRAPGRFSGRRPGDFRRSDERLRGDVGEALTRHADVDASEIEVRIAGGEVTLDGSVPDRRTKWLAEDCVLAVPGVRDVHNNLRAGRSFGGRERS